MSNRGLLYGIIGALGIATFTSMFDASFTPATQNGLYGIGGVMLIVFGLWSAIRLNRMDNQKS